MHVVARDVEHVASGLPTSGIRWGAHLCQLYRDAGDLVDVLVPYFAAGLANHERCIWITSPELGALAARAALAREVADVAERESRGQLVFVDHGALPESHGDTLADWIARERAAIADGYRGLRITGGPAWRGSRELRSSTAFEGHRIVALCSYRCDQLSPEDVLGVLRDHQGALLRRDGAWQHVTSTTAALALLGLPQPAGAGVRAHAHRVDFFDHRSFPAGEIVERLGGALARGEGAIVLATAEHGASVRAGLERRGGLDQLLDQRRVMFVDADAVYATLGGELDPVRLDEQLGDLVRDIASRCGRVHAYGELVDVACRHGNHAGAVALEQWWNAQLATLPIELDCGYTVQSFDQPSTLQAFREICDAHGVVAGGEQHDANVGRLAAELQQVTSILEVSREHLVLLQRVTAALADALTIEQIGEVVTTEIAGALGATRIALEVRGQLVALHGVTTPDDPRAVAASVQALPAARGSREDVPSELGWFGAATTVVAPVTLQGARTGTLVVGLPRDARASQRALIDDIVRQLATAVERARAIADVHQLRQRAESANAAKDRFIAMLGHELRNPLSPILMATQLMRARAPDMLPKERATIERGVSQMIRLVDDLLEVTRITRGKLELARTPVEMSQIVAQALERAVSAIEGRAHSVRLSVPSGLVVDVDPARLTQAVSNVLVNAAKYTRPGGVIEIAAERCGERVVLGITDHGIGIPTELLPHVFDLFVQGEQGIDRMRGGLGVGLAIARSIIELHGGTITAASGGADRGSTFTIALPRWVAPSAHAGLRGDALGLRILVVDDNRDAAWLVAEALTMLGHDVRVSHDGESALELARAWSPQLAFCDLGLPRMDGYALARALQELPERPRLVALTGYDQSSAREQSRAAGFDLHLIKPVGLREIQTAIDAMAG